eukprot:TRINITY_DN24003_c0_g5_i1.p1 TRINITY_DN24003_c0_g5~~TRINITY_DN24003_c0_g5_i1.p1  ORF type:complete len:356 (-),score=14.98 TRINITY_DN24003_c0_g5_i1:61-1128(-)
MEARLFNGSSFVPFSSHVCSRDGRIQVSPVSSMHPPLIAQPLSYSLTPAQGYHSGPAQLSDVASIGRVRTERYPPNSSSRVTYSTPHQLPVAPLATPPPLSSRQQLVEKFRDADPTPEDQYFIQRDLPYRRINLHLDALGWPGLLGRWSPSLASSQLPTTVITLDGTTGGTAGPRRGSAHYLAAGTAGLYDELSRRLPARGISVLQLAFRRPGPHRFDECVAEATDAALRASERGRVIIVGHSMGGAVALNAALRIQPSGCLVGVCTLASQTYGVPADLHSLSSAETLVVHGTADKALGPECSEEIWRLLSRNCNRERMRASRFVLLSDTGHCLEERREEVSELVFGWTLAAASF